MRLHFQFEQNQTASSGDAHFLKFLNTRFWGYKLLVKKFKIFYISLKGPIFMHPHLEFQENRITNGQDIRF